MYDTTPKVFSCLLLAENTLSYKLPLTLGSENAGAAVSLPMVGGSMQLLIKFLWVIYNMWGVFITLPTERQRGALLKL